MNLKSILLSLCVLMPVGFLHGQESTAPPGGNVAAVPDPGQDQFPAGFLTSRTELDNLLDGRGTTDDFETFSVADGESVNTHVFDLQDATIVNGQGPNLVHDGAVYFSADVLFWCGNGYFSLPTRTILAASQVISIGYEGLTHAMGVDLHAFQGFGSTTRVKAYSPGGQLLGSTDLTIPGNGSAVFIGFQNAGGIGAVEFINLNQAFSPILNNHTYGSICASDGCAGTETLSARVAAKACGCQVLAILKHGTRDAAYGFKMPDGECVSATANRKGKAKVKQCPSRGGKVLVQSCGLEARVRCP